MVRSILTKFLFISSCLHKLWNNASNVKKSGSIGQHRGVCE